MINIDKKGSFSLVSILLLGLSALSSVFIGHNLLTGFATLSPQNELSSIDNGANTNIFMEPAVSLFVYLISDKNQKIPYIGYSSTDSDSQIALITYTNLNFNEVINTTGQLNSSQTDKLYHPDLPAQKYSSVVMVSENAWNFKNLKIVNTTNIPPVLSNFDLDKTKAGWGETFNFSLQGDDAEDDNVDVTLYVNSSNGWVNKGETQQCHPEVGCTFPHTFTWTIDDFDSSFIGQRKYFFTKSDGTTVYNTSMFDVEITKDQLSLSLDSGDDVKVNRAGNENTTLSVKVSDVNKSEVPAGLEGQVFIQEDTSTLKNIGNCTVDNSGKCSIDLNPDSKFTVGDKMWKVRFEDSAYDTTESNYYNVSVYGNLSVALQQPSFDYTVKVGTSIPFQVAVSDDLGDSIDISPKMKLQLDENPWQDECVGNWVLGGDSYSCEWDSQGHSQGNYSILLNYSKEYYNNKIAIKYKWFSLSDAATDGQISLSSNNIAFNNITILQNQTVSTEVTYTNAGGNDASNVNLTLTGLGNGWGVNPSSGEYTCGTVGQQGGTCKETFVVTIPKGAEPKDYIMQISAHWDNPDGSLGSVNKNFNVSITSNPAVIVNSSKITATVLHGTTKQIGNFTLWSVGNMPAYSINYSISSGNLNDSWVSFSPSRIFSLSSGQKKIVNCTVTMPHMNGLYSGNFTVYPNGGLLKGSQTIEVTVPVSKTWTLSPMEKTILVEPNTNGTLITINMTNTGNAVFSLGLNHVTGNASSLVGAETMAPESFSPGELLYYTVNYSIDKTVPPGMYLLNLTFGGYDVEPEEQSSLIWLNVSDLPPVIKNVAHNPDFIDQYFNFTDESGNTGNLYMGYSVDVLDYIGIKNVTVKVTREGKSPVWAPLVYSGTDETKSGNWTIGFSSNSSGYVNLTFYVNDTSGNVVHSQPYGFYVYNKSNLNLNFNHTRPYKIVTNEIKPCSIPNVGGCIVRNFTIKNPYYAGAYYVNLSFVTPTNWIVSPSSYSQLYLASNASNSTQITFGIPTDYQENAYNISVNLTWMNPSQYISEIDDKLGVDVSNIISNLTVDVHRPHPFAEIRTGNDVDYNFSITDLDNNPISGLSPVVKIWSVDEAPFIPCDLTETSSGIYSCTGSSFGKTSGNYSMSIYAEKPYYNSLNKSFNNYFTLTDNDISVTLYTTPSGHVDIIDKTSDKNYTLLVSVGLDNTGDSIRNVNLTFLNVAPWSITENGYYNCGDIAQGESCQHNFNITIPANETLSKILTVKSAWINPDGSDGTRTITLFVKITKKGLIKIKEPLSVSVNPWVTNKFIGAFNLESVGTDSAIQINSTLSNPSDPAILNWVTFNPKAIFSFPPGTNKDINLTVTIPKGQVPGQYTADYKVIYNNKEELTSVSSTLTINVLENRDWNVTTEINHTFEQNTHGEINEPMIYNLGNVNITFTQSILPDTPDNLVSFSPSNLDIGVNDNKSLTMDYYIPSDKPAGLYPYLLTIGDTKNPASNKNVQINIRVADLPPKMTEINIDKDHADLNKENVTVTVHLADSIMVQSAWINVSSDGANIIAPMHFVSGDSGTMSGLYSGTFIPTVEGTNSIKIFSQDNTNNRGSSKSYPLNVVTGTKLNISFLQENITIDDVRYNEPAGKSVLINISNTGLAGAYDANLSFNAPLGFSLLIDGTKQSKFYPKIEENSTTQETIEIIANASVSPGIYSISAPISWINPNNLTLYSTAHAQVNITANPVLEVSGLDQSQEIKYNSPKELNVTLLSNGNVPVTGISFACKTISDPDYDICSHFDFVFDNPESLTPGLSQDAHITVLTKVGTAPKTYAGQLGITADSGISKDIDLNFHVGNSYDWYQTPKQINLTVGSNNYGNIQDLSIYNTGNVLMDYQIWQKNSSFIFLNTTNRQIQKQEDLSLKMHYNSTGLLPGTYHGKIYVNCTQDGLPPKEINVSFKVINFSISVDPIDYLPNTEAGHRIKIHAIARNATDYLINLSQIEWSAYIENDLESKAGTDMGLNLENLPQWELGWALPNVTSGRTYDLRIVGIYKKYNAFSNYIIPNIFHYRDVEAPKVLNVSAQDTSLGNTATILANVSDNVGVKNVQINVYSPQDSLVKKDNMSFVSGNEYSYGFTNTSQIGDYTYIIVPEDVNNLTSHLSSNFEVYKDINVNFKISDLKGKVIPSKISLYEEEPAIQNKPDVNITLLNQTINKIVRERNYYLEVKVLNHTIQFANVPLSQGENISLAAEIIPSRDVYFGTKGTVLDGIDLHPKNLTYSGAILIFNYSKFTNVNGEELAVASCEAWNPSIHECDGKWVTNTQVTPYTKEHTFWAAVTHFSAWVLYIPSNETTPAKSSGGNSGGGSGGSSSASVSMPSVSVSTAKINKEMNAGEDAIDSFTIVNSGKAPVSISFMVDKLQDFISFDQDSISLKNGTSRSITVHFHVPVLTQPGTYHGTIKIVGTGLEVPVTLIVKQQFEKLVDFKLDVPNNNIEENGSLNYKLNLVNVGEGSDEVPVNIYSAIMDISGTILRENQEVIVLKDKLSLVRSFNLENISIGDYLLVGAISYSDKNATASYHIKIVTKAKPVLKEQPRQWVPQNIQNFVFNARFIILFSILGLVAALLVSKQIRKVSVKKYEFPVPNLKKVPSTSVDTIQIGKITELNKPALLRLKDLSTHVICDGATGGGKTVSAQVIVEEALKHGVNVIVLDPTGQWSGFLQRCNDPEMLAHYSEFGMKSSESRGYNGNIRAIEGPNDSINITPFLNRKKQGIEGEIQIFSMHKLKNKDIELFVNSMIKQVFDANLEESNRLETLIVFDEVHRVLESFGGSMHGQDQIERGVREFRKWGVGLLLISQVISDFKEQIRANIGTKIQFRSRDKNDLKMIKETFGIEYVRHIVKAAIGRGMLHNPGYNKGMPYFVDIRPLLHHPHKLTNAELEKYEHYNKIVDDLNRKIRLMKSRGGDVFDILSILKLLEKNIKKGKFDMVDIYLDEIKEKMNR